MNGILCITLLFKKRNSFLKIIITGIFPRDDSFSRFGIIAPQNKQLLKILTTTYDFIGSFEQTKNWLKCHGDLNNKLLWADYLHLPKFGNKIFASLVFTQLHQNKIVSMYPKLAPVSSVVCKFSILFQRVCEADPPCYVTVDVSIVKNQYCWRLSYHCGSFNFFVSRQSICEVNLIYVDVVHETTDVTVKH